MVKGLEYAADLRWAFIRKEMDMCDYHEHTNDEERKQCKEGREARAAMAKK
jgi:hypothetical protein